MVVRSVQVKCLWPSVCFVRLEGPEQSQLLVHVNLHVQCLHPLSRHSLQAAREALCSHKAARHIALHLLAPSTKRYLPAHAAAMLSPPTAPAPVADGAPAAAANSDKPAEDDKDEADDDMVGHSTRA